MAGVNLDLESLSVLISNLSNIQANLTNVLKDFHVANNLLNNSFNGNQIANFQDSLNSWTTNVANITDQMGRYNGALQNMLDDSSSHISRLNGMH
ncbi:MULTISPECIES: hypothetical protein [Ktedonobacter]|uniref:WXG100 family type VII secretion target n=1 Tax=Ktedonobacter robiniae TaxID=2778365 RepID=A0ABQ3UKI1_9CHLR|nr:MULTISPECIES: hypothetical protein [Ktedonobacter]GHO53183.1 hypothetical protein KSB_16580 [Ktedonobacter robiniae]GHO69344.1 hypothetical protein KSC_082360 [Ktedonobacter sp. SOSP1-52]